MDSAEQLAERVIAVLAGNGQHLGIVESCTGGRLAAVITGVPGASAVFNGGLVAYSNNFKSSILGVDELTLDGFGAVSAECACEMACNGEMVLGTDYTVAVTGIAGPTGGSAEKPVGTVFIAWSGPDGVEVEQHCFVGARADVQQQAVDRALQKLAELLDQPC